MKASGFGFFESKIDVSRFFGGEPGELVLTFREPNEDEFFKLAGEMKNNDSPEMRREVFWNCLKDWTIEDDNGNKIEKKKAVDLIKKSSAAVMVASREFYETIPLAKETLGSADKSPASSSREDK